MNQGDPQLGAAQRWIQKSLRGAADPHFKQALAPLLADRIAPQQHTSQLDSPEKLGDLLRASDLIPGQYVEGAAFFSHSTMSHEPMTLGPRVARFMDDVMQRLEQGQLLTNGPKYRLPTTRFPRVHKAYEIGFLYPLHMYGFVVPLAHDNTVQSLPFRGRLVCILNKPGSHAHLECRIVRYRARVMTVGLDDLRMIYPGVVEGDCSDLLAGNGSCFLAIVDNDTCIELAENSPVETANVPWIGGAHFLEIHWEQPHVMADIHNFPHVLQGALFSAIGGRSQVGPVTRALDDINQINIWSSRTIEVTQPVNFPYFHFRLNAPLSDRPHRRLARDAFNKISETTIAEINKYYAIDVDCSDLNCIDGYASSRHSILRSKAALTIADAVSSVVRDWLTRPC